MTKLEKIKSLPSTGERFLPEWGGESELEHMHRYAMASELVNGMAILDIASGEGYGSSMLAERAKSVIGVDISKEAVSHAKRNYRRKNLQFRVGSCSKIPLKDNSVDIVVSFETIEHHDKHTEMITEIKRVLKPRGVVIISSPDRRNYSEAPGIENPYHIKELYEEEFKGLINQHFKKSAFFGQRIAHGSYVVRDDKVDGLINFKKTPKKIERNGSNHLPVFWIAVASDAALPDLSSSVFETSNNEISSLKSVLSDRNEYISHLENSVKSRDDDLFEAKKVVSERDKYISHLESAIESREDEQSGINNVLLERDDYIKHLEGTLKSRDSEKVTLGSQLAELNVQYEETSLAIKQRQAELLQTKDVIAERNNFISHLQSTLKGRDDELELHESVIRERNRFIRHLEENLEGNSTEISELKSVVNDRNEFIEHLKKSLSLQEESSRQSEDIIRLRDDYIQGLEASLKTKEKSLDKFNAIVEERNIFIDHLETTLVARDEDIQHHSNVISERNEYIAHLETSLKVTEQQVSALTKVIENKDKDLILANERLDTVSQDFANVRETLLTREATMAEQNVEKKHLQNEIFLGEKMLLQRQLQIKDREDQIASLKGVQYTHETQLSIYEKTIHEYYARIESQDNKLLSQDNDLKSLKAQATDVATKLSSQEDMLELQDQYLSHLEGMRNNQTATVRRHHEVIEDRNAYVQHLVGALAKYESDISQLHDENQALKSHFDRLTEEVYIRDIAVENLRKSHSWRITAPLRRLRGGNPKDHEPYHDSWPAPLAASNVSKQIPSFFTICSKNFLAHARVLYRSIMEHYPTSRFFVVLCDRLDGYLDPTKEPFEFIYLDDLGINDYEGMSQRYNITEFNTAVKPFAFLHLMTNLGMDRVMYVDPDLLFVDKLEELDERLDAGAEAVLTPHIIQPKEQDQIHDSKFLQFGIYNLGFLAVRKTPKVLDFMAWWGRRLEHECVIRLEDGLFVDQKWADLLPAFVPGAEVINHPGYNVAYWNLPHRIVTQDNDKWSVNGQPLRFVHFSGNKIDDPNIFSRHSQQVTVDTVGDLRELLKYYADSVFAQGHKFYRKLPYAFSWDGEAGINLHTPKDLDVSNALEETLKQPAYIGSELSQKSIVVKEKPSQLKSKPPRNGILRKAKILKDALPVAKRASGGWIPLTGRAYRSFRKNGLQHVKERGVVLSQYKLPKKIATTVEKNDALGSKKHLLYMDWGIPKPDQDAGSIWAVTLMKVFQSLGYRVTFLPCSLQYEPQYYEDLTNIGIEVCCHPNVTNVEDWLKENSARFEMCFLSRGPVVCHYVDIIKACAPNARLVYNTADLHYMREMREAMLKNDMEALANVKQTKEYEIGLTKKCDVTIVHSVEEAYVLRKDVPEVPLANLPLLFEDMPGVKKPFSKRSGAVFIGGFNHQPNSDAVIYFIDDLLPEIRKHIPSFKFHVVGSNAPEEILNRANLPGVVIHGFVQNLDKIFQSVRMSVAPLRYGAGIKGKIGTSFCYALPCVATLVAVEGMALTDGLNIAIGDSNQEMIEKIIQVHSDESLWERLGDGGFKFAKEHYSFEAVQKQVAKIFDNVKGGRQHLKSFYELSDWQSAQAHFKVMSEEYGKRINKEVSLLPELGIEGFHTKGHCAVCNVDTDLLSSFMYTTHDTPCGRPMPNWREHMQCPSCGLVNRMRAALHIFQSFYTPDANSRIYITERVTQTYDWLDARFLHLQGSEYYGPDYLPGSEVNGNRHEDVQNLSFENNVFDFVLSFDVLEHVPDPDAAFEHIFRTLDHGGVFIFSVPFAADSYEDIVRATVNEEGEIVHHMEPEYHGNPVDPEGGALCFRYLGWSALDRLRDIGFANVRVVAYWSETQGYLGKEQYMLIAEKP